MTDNDRDVTMQEYHDYVRSQRNQVFNATPRQVGKSNLVGNPRFDRNRGLDVLPTPDRARDLFRTHDVIRWSHRPHNRSRVYTYATICIDFDHWYSSCADENIFVDRVMTYGQLYHLLTGPNVGDVFVAMDWMRLYTDPF